MNYEFCSILTIHNLPSELLKNGHPNAKIYQRNHHKLDEKIKEKVYKKIGFCFQGIWIYSISYRIEPATNATRPIANAILISEAVLPTFLRSE